MSTIAWTKKSRFQIFTRGCSDVKDKLPTLSFLVYTACLTFSSANGSNRKVLGHSLSVKQLYILLLKIGQEMWHYTQNCTVQLQVLKFLNWELFMSDKFGVWSKIVRNHKTFNVQQLLLQVNQYNLFGEIYVFLSMS